MIKVEKNVSKFFKFIFEEKHGSTIIPSLKKIITMDFTMNYIPLPEE